MSEPPVPDSVFGPPRRELAAELRRHTEGVISRWETAVREALTGARGTPRLVLIDFLRETLNDLADAIERRCAGTGPASARMAAYASVHGRERAAVPSYDVGQVVHEYRLLRGAIIGELSEHTALSIADIYALADCIDQTIEIAVDAFTDALHEAKLDQTRGLVHDLLNPLSIVRMDTQLIARSAENPARVGQAAEQILGAADRIESLVRSLLDALRLEAGETMRLRFAHLDIREPLEGVIKSAKRAYGDRFRTEWPDTPIVGRFAPAGVVRILENLISNAVKHGDPDRAITITLKDGGDTVALRVHNWGRPVSPAQRERLFTDFYRSEDRPDGWGLGLGVVRSVAEAHGGNTTLESEAATGTSFIVTLRKDTRDSAVATTSLHQT